MAADSLKHYDAPSPWSYDAPATVAVNPDSVAFVPSTVLVDSIAADTVHGRIPHFITAEEADSLQVEALLDSISAADPGIELPSGASEGIVSEAVSPHYSHSTPLTALLMGSLLVCGFNAAGLRRALKSYRHEIWSVRRRPNVFDDERATGLPAAVLLALVFVVFAGVVAYNLPGLPPAPSFAGACAAMALTGGFYLFHFLAYNAVGYAFGTRVERRRWVDGFLATTAYAGLLLALPAFLLIYRPEWHGILLIVSVSIYLLAKLLFIIKGVRIFFKGFRSLLYFILYLCTLEIIPAILFYRICFYLQGLDY